MKQEKNKHIKIPITLIIKSIVKLYKILKKGK